MGNRTPERKDPLPHSTTTQRPKRPPAHRSSAQPQRAAHTQQTARGGSSAAASRQGKRRRTLIGLLILLLSAALLGLIAWLVVRAQSAALAPKPEAAQVQPAPPAAAAENTTPAITIPAAVGEWDVAGIPPLYNKDNPIADDARAALTLVDAGGGQQLETTAAAAFLAMQQAAAADGVTLTPISGFRTFERQQSNYNSSVQSHMAAGATEEEATRLTGQYYALPGTSEHEMGLAMDIGVVNDSFADTPAYAWLQEHCVEYGFIYRYPQGYEETTGINWEPWHYRFIGQNHAREYTSLGMATLEDYVARLQTAT